MFFQRPIIARTFLIAFTALCANTFFCCPEWEENFKTGNNSTQLSENAVSRNLVSLRTAMDAMVNIFEASIDHNFTSFETVLSNTLRIRFLQAKTEKDQFRSSLKFYLHYLSILV